MLMLQTVASYPEDLTKVFNECDCTKQQIFNVETISSGRKFHLGLLQLEKSMSGFKASEDFMRVELQLVT